jgi:hypothetical protein
VKKPFQRHEKEGMSNVKDGAHDADVKKANALDDMANEGNDPRQ